MGCSFSSFWLEQKKSKCYVLWAQEPQEIFILSVPLIIWLLLCGVVRSRDCIIYMGYKTKSFRASILPRDTLWQVKRFSYLWTDSNPTLHLKISLIRAYAPKAIILSVQGTYQGYWNLDHIFNSQQSYCRLCFTHQSCNCYTCESLTLGI